MRLAFKALVEKAKAARYKKLELRPEVDAGRNFSLWVKMMTGK